MKFLIIGDVHLADRPPSVRTETYTEDILAKLAYAVELAKSSDCEAILQAGDLFHIKTPTRNSHALVQRTHEVLTSAGLPVLITPGNHDLSNDRLDSLKKQPLGSLARMGGVDLLIGPHATFPLFGLPYLADWANDLPRWMSKYNSWCDQRKSEDFGFFPLMITHAPIFPNGEEPPYDFIPAGEWAGVMQNGDFYYGHIHDPHGAYKADNAIWACNQGAISRGSLHEKTLKREPAVTIWDTENIDEHGCRFTRYPVPYRPAEAVFRLAEKEDVDERSGRVEEFLSQVGQTRLDGLSLEEVHAQARERGMPDRTVKLIHELLENA